MARSLMRYHPRIGFTYMPSTRMRVQRPGGGYLVRTNGAGFRSDREFVRPRSPETHRVLLFGDSQTAGDGTANPRRFGDLLETEVPGLEVHNYGLSGSGTDQQRLAYEEHRSVEHDLVIIVPYAENVRRLSRRILRARDEAGDVLFRSKPYYELVGDQLVLRNVPVPRQVWTEATLPTELRQHVYVFGEEYSFFRNPAGRHAALLGKLAPSGALRRTAKGAVRSFRPFEPLPEYASPDHHLWRLQRSILHEWVTTSDTPVLVVPLPHESALRGASDASTFRQRFRELAADTGCTLHDPFDDLLAATAGDAPIWSNDSGHLSEAGHATLARSIAPAARALLPGAPPRPTRDG